MLPTVGAAGIALTVATVMALVEVQPFTVTFTLYTPEAFVVAPVMEGFCAAEVKLLGAGPTVGGASDCRSGQIQGAARRKSGRCYQWLAQLVSR